MNGRTIRLLLWIVALTGVVGSGCIGEPKTPPRQADRQPNRIVQTAQWGPDTQGVQCRIRPIKRLWRADEPPVFKVDFRNRGKRAFALLDDGSVHAERILVDNRWYSRPWLGAAEGKPKLFGPGDQLEGLSLRLSGEMSLPLGYGSHTIQVAFLFEGLEIVSNSVDIEILSR